MATVLRDEKHAEGVLMFWNAKLNIYNKEKREKQQEEAKKTEQQPQESMTWDAILKNLPGF
jgi:hypothetical protein